MTRTQKPRKRGHPQSRTVHEIALSHITSTFYVYYVIYWYWYMFGFPQTFKDSNARVLLFFVCPRVRCRCWEEEAWTRPYTEQPDQRYPRSGLNWSSVALLTRVVILHDTLIVFSTSKYHSFGRCLHRFGRHFVRFTGFRPKIPRGYWLALRLKFRHVISLVFGSYWKRATTSSLWHETSGGRAHDPLINGGTSWAKFC